MASKKKIIRRMYTLATYTVKNYQRTHGYTNTSTHQNLNQLKCISNQQMKCKYANIQWLWVLNWHLVVDIINDNILMVLFVVGLDVLFHENNIIYIQCYLMIGYKNITNINNSNINNIITSLYH